ncbi:Phosphatidylinositol-4-phosphate 5-kinase [Elasticomyces elasticus]|nr:Phosphatidylinositol-4-phosphate 5-kinase [Elasticomyces elasticus]KAK3665382.1 Phosphatidylinositol-4-phosphate 5-kinase [Elasticomyces elasticus]KAK4929643.1 Phosphatidylinositol-4-phosphate 5-kinase [Elasticomyces elasticus]KAK5761135.1 Phosphatidylinositol-4-phosphate 5-kinase [Elasticomyces elasticus]
MPEATVLVTGAPSSMRQSELAQYQMLWDERMRFPSRRIRHTKTAVLLLSWAPELDDLHVQSEMSDLRLVFEELYGFKVREETLNLKRKAQHQASRILSDFVHEEDAEQGLLIVYYAGHGYTSEASESGELNMIGSRAPPSTMEHARQEFQKDPSVMWSTVSQPIENADADVLLIFDCCHAGLLARPFARYPQSPYEFLGACSESNGTPRPGPTSFTTALTWALRQLATKDRPFNTAELRSKLCKHEAFPKKQIPVLAPLRPGEHIVISRKGLKPGTTEQAPTKSEQKNKLSNRESVHVQFHFDHKVNNGDVEAMADTLRDIMDHDEIQTPWSRASFQGKSSELLNPMSLQDMARATQVAATWKGSLGRRRKGSCSISPIDSQTSFATTPVTVIEAQPLTLTIPDLSSMRDGPSSASSLTDVAINTENMPLLPKDNAEHARGHNDHSIVFHLHAIFCKLLVIFWRTVSWHTFRSGLRNSDRVVDQESQG